MLKTPSEITRCTVDLTTELSETTQFDKWFRVEEEKAGSPQKFASFGEFYTDANELTPVKPTRAMGTIRVVFNLHERATPKVSMKKLPSGSTSCQRCPALENLVRAQQSDLYTAEGRLRLESNLADLLAGSPFQSNYEYIDVSKLDSKTFLVSFPNVNEITQKDIDHLKLCLISCNEKMKSFEVMQREIDKLRVELQNSYTQRGDLNDQMKRGIATNQDESASQSKQMDKIIAERNKAVDSLQKLHTQLKHAESRAETLEFEVNELKRTLTSNQATRVNVKDMQTECESLKVAYIELEEQRDAIREIHTKSLSEFENRCKTLQRTVEMGNKEKISFREEIGRLNQRILERSNEVDERDQEIEELKCKLAQVQASISDVCPQNPSEGLNTEASSAKTKLTTALSSATKDFEKQVKIWKDSNEALIQDKHHLTQTVAQLEAQVEGLSKQLQNSKRDNFSLSTNVSSLEQMTHSMQDELDRANQNKALTKYDTHLNQNLLKEMNLLSDYILEQSEKLLHSNKLLEKVRDEMEHKDLEAVKLKKMIIEARPEQYRADNDDPIDLAIGEFINQREEPLTVPFTRENTGVYLFGTRRIFVKIEQGKLIFKCGGGYMLPEELVAVYTHNELEKQMAKRAASMQQLTLKDKLSSTLMSNYMKDDRSLSPQRASQMVRESLGSKFSSAVGVIDRKSPGPEKKRISKRKS